MVILIGRKIWGQCKEYESFIGQHSVEALAEALMKWRYIKSNRCYWCKSEVFPSGQVGIAHPKCATIDHLRSKPECTSKAEYVNRRNKVTACYECNQRRGQEWCKRLADGIVFPTEWSLRMAAKDGLSRNRKREKAAAQKRLEEESPPCRFTPITVPAELDAAYD